MIYQKNNNFNIDDDQFICFFELLSIEKDENFKVVMLEELNLSMCFYNALKLNGCNNAWDLMSMNISNIKNLGNQNIDEVIEALKKFKKNLTHVKTFEIDDQEYNIYVGEEVLEIIEDILYGRYTEIENLACDNSNANFFLHVIQIVELLDTDICKFAFYNPKKTIRIINAMNNFIQKVDLFNHRKEKFESYFAKIHPLWLHASVLSLVTAYKGNKENTKKLLEIFRSCDMVYQLPSVFLEIHQDEDSFYLLCDFCEFLSKSLEQMAKKISSKLFLNKNSFTVINGRSKGQTLESIGQVLNVTRERVRQIESKALKLACVVPQFVISILWCSSALQNGSKIISSNNLIKNLGNEGDHIVYLLKNYKNSDYKYVPDMDCFLLCDDQTEKAAEVISNLPETVLVTQVNDLLRNSSKEFYLFYEFLEIAFYKKYKLYGTVYTKKNISLSDIYEYMLLNFYPHGIKLFDASETEKFRQNIIRVFGYMELPLSDRAIDARIADISMLCDRGMYIHPSYAKIPVELIDEIDHFIETSDRDSISYLELFEIFESKLLLSSNVSNRYYLQGVIKHKLASKYYISRDYVSKKKHQTISDEIVKFIKIKGEVSRDEIKFAFAGITEAMISQIITREFDIVSFDNGYYIHADALDILESDYDMSKIIDENIIERPASSRKLFEAFSTISPEFLLRNNINSHSKLFGVLRYMFMDKYKFSRPYVSLKKCLDISKVDIIIREFKEMDFVNFDELIEFCEVEHIEYQSLTIFINSLNNFFLIADEDNLININMLAINKELLETIHKLLVEDIERKGYISAKKMDTFIYYPDIGARWTGWLLVSITKKYFDDITILKAHSTNRKVLTEIFVSSTLRFEKYEYFLKWLVKTENTRSPFFEFDEIREWLIGEGLINAKLPNCITEYAYKNEYGRIMTP